MKKFFNNYFISFILGLIGALGLAPINFFPASIISISGLFLISAQAQNKKSAFWLGWSFGFGYFLAGLYWISIALLADAEKFAWLMPFAISLIPAAIACYIGLIILLNNFLANYFAINKVQKLWLLAVIWVFFEWLRSWLFTGFPWNLLGYHWGFSAEISQIAAIFGIYGLTLLGLISFGSGALFFQFQENKLRWKFDKISLINTLLVLILLSSAWFYGYGRLKNQNQLIAGGNLRLVQPNIPQDQKWDEQSRYNSFAENITLSNSVSLENINLVIWSESAVSYAISPNNQELLGQIARAAPKNGFVITGGLRAQFKDRQLEQIWNTVFAINSQSQIKDFYDKNHLVPFGEYIPFQRFLPFLDKITYGSVGFGSGSKLKTIKLNDALPSFGPLICYEIIFSDKIIDRNNPPQFLINVTNDAWFGNSSGPYQHLAMAQIRAIEYGLPIARAANSGISALIDPYGRIIAQLDLNKKGILDVKLMKNLSPTFYAQHGLKPILAILALILIIILISNKLINKRHNNQ